MTSPTGNIRPIRYPLNRSNDLESDTPNTPPIENLTLDNWVTSDPDERVPIVLEVSLNEYVALATCVDVGRDIAYGDNSIYLWWIWVRSLLGMDLCDLVLNCVLTNEDIQQAIANYSLGSAINGNSQEIQTVLDSEILSNQGSCDNDNIYGMTVQLVKFVNSINEDILELFVNAPFAAARLGDIVEAIPGIGQLPFDDALQFADNFLEDINDAYQAAYTVSLEIDMACDLFCIAQENGCSLTWEQVRDYYADKVQIALDTTDFLQFIEDVIANNWIGTTTVYVMYYLFFQTLIFGGEILGQNFTKITNLIASMFNDPDPDWSTNCDCGWIYTQDWLTTQDNWVAQIGGTAATWSNGVGWSSVDISTGSPDPYRRISAIQIDIPSTPIDSVKLTYNLTKGTILLGSANGLSIVVKKANLLDVRHDLTFDELVNGNGQVEIFLPDEPDVTQIRLSLSSSYSNNNQDYSGVSKLVSVEVRGTGTNPF